MSFASPLWLLLLIPWLAVVFYLLLGKPPRKQVPFLWLWRGPEAKRKAKPSLAKLPVWIALMMLGSGVAIVAAAGPGWVHSRPPAASQGRVGIAGASVRGKQVMVRLLNESTRREVAVTLSANAREPRTETVALPESDERAYFLPIPDAAGLRVTVDGQSVDLNRRRTWPKIEPRFPLPDALRRMLIVYSRTRPAGDDSAAVAIAADEPSLAGQAGVILAEPTARAVGKVAVIDHPLTRIVNWPGILADAKLAPMPPGFTPLVKAGEQPAIAFRDSPRQVWVGFESPGFASTVDYVVFWANVFDFAGEGTDEWVVAAETTFAQPTPPVVQTRVQNLAPWLACIATALVLIALLTARRRGLLR